ncbi:MAG TPA: DinB family protein [Acidimicrobiia bacterium]|jgi:uncharacterized damage-inducible protein DinB
MTTERDDLIDVLDKQRGFLRHAVAGLTDEQAATRTTASELCLGGIVKHVTRVEQRWANFIVNGPGAIGTMDEAAYAAHAASFRMEPSETLADALARYDETAQQTERLIRSLPSLDVDHPLPEAPWFEPGARWSARRALIHVLAETAQHSGHADILREALDGQKTMG